MGKVYLADESNGKLSPESLTLFLNMPEILLLNK